MFTLTNSTEIGCGFIVMGWGEGSMRSMEKREVFFKGCGDVLQLDSSDDFTTL
jgi:hypothetical protein